jgi:hypothetical protein
MGESPRAVLSLHEKMPARSSSSLPLQVYMAHCWFSIFIYPAIGTHDGAALPGLYFKSVSQPPLTAPIPPPSSSSFLFSSTPSSQSSRPLLATSIFSSIPPQALTQRPSSQIARSLSLYYLWQLRPHWHPPLATLP